MEKGGLVEDVCVVLDHLLEFVVSVVLVLDIGDEPCTTEFRKDCALERSEDLGHVPDLALAYGGITVHTENPENQVLVLYVGCCNQLLESFPVLTDALDGHIAGLLALGDLLEGIVCSLGAVLGKLVVESLLSVGRSIGNNLSALQGLPGVAGNLVESCLEVLDGLAAQLLLVHVRGVDLVEDLSFLGLFDDRLIVVVLEGNAHCGAVLMAEGDEHVCRIAAISGLLLGQVVGLTLVLHHAAENELCLFHAGLIVEVHAAADGTALGADGPVVVLHLFSLIHERLSLCLTAIVYEYGSNFEDCLRKEVVCGIGDRNIGIDLAGNYFEHLRVGSHFYIVCQLCHLRRRGTGNCRSAKDCGCHDSESFSHI